MEIEIYLASTEWQEKAVSSNQKYAVRGMCFGNEESAAVFNGIETAVKYAQELNGFFAFVFRGDGVLFACVDIIRSIPLFYSVRDSKFFISDSADWVCEKVGDLDMDPVAKDLFQLSGYVPGAGTLYPNVKQLQAGECLSVGLESNGRGVSLKRYFTFQHRSPHFFDKESAIAEISKRAFESIDFLIEYARGRKILLPLSGGYDSRLIATILRARGYENVMSFSYGVRGNKEAQAAHLIAKSLGFEWRFVEYTNEEWSAAWSSVSAENYRHYASSFTSLPHVQDWLAIKKLVEESDVGKDVVVVPGHCCVTSYIPESLIRVDKDFLTVVLDNIKATHFSCRPIRESAALTDAMLDEIILGSLSLQNPMDLDSAASMVMEFNWSERQSKYIANSVRVYEFFGLDWWLPLWDRRFVDFWREIPAEYRFNRKLYKEFVSRVYAELADKEFAPLDVVRGVEEKGVPIGVKRFLSTIAKPVFFALKKMKIERSYTKHFLALGGLVPQKCIKEYVRKGYTIIGIYAELFLAGRWGR